VVPLTAGQKAPSATNWIRLVFKADDFKPDDNIGIRSTNGLVDIDCDAAEVVLVASHFLPTTGAIYGRTSKPRAHWLYTSGFEKPIVYKDQCVAADKATLIEIRVNHQSMAPPSMHPDGERIEWVGQCGEATKVDAEDLVRAVRLCATCALIARHYNPPGDRHDWGLALAGALHRFGLTEEECAKVITVAASVVKDKEVKDRLAAIKSTYARNDDDPLKSFNALIETMKDKGKPFVATLQKIWGAVKSVFILDDKGKVIKDSTENVRRALAKLEVTLAFDAFSQKPLISYGGFRGVMQDPLINRLWFKIEEEFHFRPSIEFFNAVVQDTAWRNQVHPVRDYLASLEWDGRARLNRWLIDYGGAADNDYTQAVGSLVLIAAVRRVMRPGCKFDELLVLESEQGQLKSTALRTLCPNDDWFTDDLPLNIDAKEVIEGTRGKWIIEASELSGFRASQMEHLKAMLSRQVDGPVRMAYARIAVEQPRQFIIIGTTNSHQYLKDATGNRRFWPVRILKFDVNALRRDRDQLWAEAFIREAKNESIRLDPKLYNLATTQQERRRIEDPWETILERKFPPGEKHRLTPDRIWDALGIPVERRDDRANARVITVLQRMGFRRLSVRDDDNKVCKGWGYDPGDLPKE